MLLRHFYRREAEQALLLEEARLSRALKSARLVVVTGRRRVGKTELILQSLSRSSEVPFIYLFAARAAASVLIAEWARTIASAIGMPFLPQFDRLAPIVGFLLEAAQARPIHVIIDGCEALNVIEPSFWSELASIWDRRRQGAQMLLVMSSGAPAAMRRLYLSESGPLLVVRTNSSLFSRSW